MIPENAHTEACNDDQQRHARVPEQSPVIGWLAQKRLLMMFEHTAHFVACFLRRCNPRDFAQSHLRDRHYTA
jgi:hypothetical protein